jgi:hypothetical protein
MIDITNVIDLRFDQSIFTNTKDGLVVEAIEKVYQFNSTFKDVLVVITRGKTVHKHHLNTQAIMKLYQNDVLNFFVNESTCTSEEIYKSIIKIMWFHYVNIAGVKMVCLIM